MNIIIIISNRNRARQNERKRTAVNERANEETAKEVPIDCVLTNRILPAPKKKKKKKKQKEYVWLCVWKRGRSRTYAIRLIAIACAFSFRFKNHFHHSLGFDLRVEQFESAQRWVWNLSNIATITGDRRDWSLALPFFLLFFECHLPFPVVFIVFPFSP